MIDNGMAEFFNPIPNLKAWFGNEYQQRAVAFHVEQNMQASHRMNTI